jgi:Ca-activated chloride channel family protein
MLEDLHFLRPEWLWLLVAVAILWLLVSRRESSERQWRRFIAPHLFEHLRVGVSRRSWFSPLHLVLFVLVLASVALAGPTWEREVSPFAEDTAPLIIALDVSGSMNAVDVQPTRLERGKQKVRDLLAARTGARTALIAYAGSAHIVLPLCDDPSLFETFLAALETDVMPRRGKEPSGALELAERLLADEDVVGSILFVTDGIATSHTATFRDHALRSEDEIMVLAVGTREGAYVRIGEGEFEKDDAGRLRVAALDLEGLEALRSEAGIFVVGSTVDDSDVGRVQRRVQSHLQSVQQQDETSRWKDQGYWLTLPIALLCLLWFRKGWTVSWARVVMLFLLTTGCDARPDRQPGLVNLLLTPDQQGRLLFERGRFGEAAELFEDPMWKGIAFYRGGDLEQAAEAFARAVTADAVFNLGNSYAGLARYEEAVAAYDAALTERPDWQEAVENRAAVQAYIPSEYEPDEEQAGGEPSLPPDEMSFDEKGEKGKEGQVELSQLTDEQLAEMWLRRLDTRPADFLRQRFAIEAAMAASETPE